MKVVMNMLSSTLKRLRVEKGLTQADIAEMIGVSQQAVGKWERGLSAPDYDALINLAKYHGVSTDYLLGLKSKEAAIKMDYVRSVLAELEKDEPQQPQDQPLSPEEKALLEAYRNASDRDKNLVDTILHPSVSSATGKEVS